MLPTFYSFITIKDALRPLKDEKVKNWLHWPLPHCPTSGWQPLSLSFTFSFLPFFSEVLPLLRSARLQLAQMLPPMYFAMELYSCDGLWCYDEMNPKCLHSADSQDESLFHYLSLGLGIPLHWWDDNGTQLCIIKVQSLPLISVLKQMPYLTSLDKAFQISETYCHIQRWIYPMPRFYGPVNAA